MDKLYDIIIIGGGPAGYTAALYGARAGFETLVLEKFSAGGQMTETPQIDNYPGFDEGIDGFTLGFKMQQGAERFGAKTVQTEVTSVNLDEKIKIISTPDGDYKTRCLIIATGATHRHLGLENEENLIGKGVGYCAYCDGMFFRGKTVAVIGGGNSAAADALYLSKICNKVYLIHRRDKLRAERIYHTPLMNAKNVEFCWNSTVSDILYNETVTGLKIKDILSETEKEIPLDGVFISIGREPQTSLFKDKLNIDKNGYIIADESTRTSVDGVFAVGDVRTKFMRQIVTAAADGATAIHFAEEYLSQN